jgi:hypothetical protein
MDRGIAMSATDIIGRSSMTISSAGFSPQEVAVQNLSEGKLSPQRDRPNGRTRHTLELLPLWNRFTSNVSQIVMLA